MKFNHLCAISAVALAFGASDARATVCGGVDGNLTVTGFEGMTPVSCAAAPTSFAFAVDDSSFLVSAVLTTTSILLSMNTGDTGGFGSDAFWSLTLGAGSTFDPATSTELSDTFALDSTVPDGVAGGAEFTGFTNGFTTANFRIIGADHPYNNDGQFAAEYKVSVITAVPEPGTWAMMIGGLGLLAYVRRKRV